MSFVESKVSCRWIYRDRHYVWTLSFARGHYYYVFTLPTLCDCNFSTGKRKSVFYQIFFCGYELALLKFIMETKWENITRVTRVTYRLEEVTRRITLRLATCICDASVCVCVCTAIMRRAWMMYFLFILFTSQVVNF